jgi:predicted TIM-barrel fold metal-dependent hydrolase
MDLRAEINSIKIIDDHQHAIDPFYWQEALGVLPPFPPEVHGLEIPTPATHLSKTKKLIAMFQALYGFPYSTITQENEKELQAMYDRSKGDEASIYHKVMDLAGIEMAFQICLTRPVLSPSLDSKRFKRVALADGFLIPFENSELKKFSKKSELFITLAEVSAQNMKKELNWYPHSFDEYLNFITAVIKKLQEQGCVALKAFSGQWRGLDFEWVSEEEARSVFGSKDTKPERYKHLQDYLLKYILMKCSEIGLPFQMHSGAGGGGEGGFTRENDPSLFDRLLWHPDVKTTKVVILHGGYPYCREAGFMVSGFGRRPRSVYLDTGIMWADHPTPNASYLVHILREWLEMGLSSKLIYGSDATSPFKLWMSAMDFREDLYTALKGMIDEGLISESQALSMAEQILRGNAETVYGL